MHGCVFPIDMKTTKPILIKNCEKFQSSVACNFIKFGEKINFKKILEVGIIYNIKINRKI